MALVGILKQSTAATIRLGPHLDETDGKTAETGLTVNQAAVRLGKNGGAGAQKNDSGAGTHDELGYYLTPLNATDTNALGILSVYTHISGALPVRQDYLVVHASVYDLFCTYGLIMLGAAGPFTAQAGAAGSLTGAASESATDDINNGQTAAIIAGTGAGQSRVITDYVGSTKVMTTDPNYVTNPDNTSVYMRHASAPSPTTALTPVDVKAIEGKTLSGKAGDNFDVFFHNGGADSTVTQDDAAGAGASAADIAAAVADVALASHTTAGSLGQRIGRIPNASPGAAGGLPTVDASNQVNAVLSSAERLAAADALLTRDMSAVTEGSGRTPLQALRALRNKVTVAAGTATVTKEDDSTSSWTASVTGTPAVTSVDPA